MTDLLAADFSRMLKSMPFIGCVLFCFDFPIVMIINMKYTTGSDLSDGIKTLIFLLMGLLMAVFVSSFVGTEYDDHIIRNKVLVGRSRVKIYLSNYIVCLTAGFIMQTVFFITACIAPLVAFNFGMTSKMMLPLSMLLKCQLIGLYIMAAYTGMFVFFCMTIQNQAYSTVTCVALAALMFAVGYAVSLSVAPPVDIFYEMSFVPQSMINSMRGMAIENEKKRALYKLIDDILPSCHAYNIRSGFTTGRPLVNVLSDTVISLGFTIVGVISFRKKDFV